MSEPPRVRCHLNSNLQWHRRPYIPGWMREHPRTFGYDPEYGMEGVEPDLWAMEAGFVCDRIYESDVGRILLDSIRHRTTIYQSRHPQTGPDTFDESAPGEPERRARSASGGRAAIFVDLARAARPESGLVRSRTQSLVHELAHAVRINYGLYNHDVYPGGAAAFARIGANSPEEEAAWIVENMYRLEIGMPGRDRYYESHSLPADAVPGPANTRTNLRAIEERVVRRWHQRSPGVAARFANIRSGRYNPFRRILRGSRT